MHYNCGGSSSIKCYQWRENLFFFKTSLYCVLCIIKFLFYILTHLSLCVLIFFIEVFLSLNIKKYRLNNKKCEIWPLDGQEKGELARCGIRSVFRASLNVKSIVSVNNIPFVCHCVSKVLYKIFFNILNFGDVGLSFELTSIRYFRYYFSFYLCNLDMCF